MSSTSRPQQRYDHRLRDLVQRTGDPSIATDLGVPRSTARGWLGATPTGVVTLDLADLTEPELRQEILMLRRCVEKLAALLRLALALLRASGFRLSGERLPDGPAKRRILRAVDRARECLPLRAVLRFLGLSPSPPVVLADAGVENVNAEVDELIETGVLRRLLPFTELVLEFADRSLVAFPETPMAVPPLARQRFDHPPTGDVLRPRAQPRAAALGVPRADAE